MDMMSIPSYVFSARETALMREIYLLASNAFAATHALTNEIRYRLASIGMGLVAEGRHFDRSGAIDRAAVAEKAIGILLRLPIARSQMDS